MTDPPRARPWDAEVAVTADDARILVERQFPGLAPARVEPLAEGWDNTAVLVNGRYVFRFPRRALGAACLEAEIRVMPPIAARLPLPVTAPAFLGRPHGGFPWAFAGYPYLPGRPVPAADLDDERRAAAAAPLGRFLAALHAIGADEATALGADRDAVRKLDPARRIPRTHEHLGRMRRLGLVDDTAPWEPIVEAAAALRPPRDAALCHGDLDARHVLVDDDGVPTGIIDWGDVHLGDPATDLALGWGMLPPAARAAFRAAYGPIDDDTWRLARFRALNVATVTAVHGRETGDDALVRESLVTLRHVLVG
ncbi:MAG: phosphotransferase [Planctomycetota bacterium]|jgi:aminoglycoside phosphotransferase (APT) family kinase protein